MTQFFLKIGWVVIVGLTIGCNFQKETVLSGRTMGTFYHIKLVTSYFARTQSLQQLIDQRLEAINHHMSTFDKESEISRFNRYTDLERPFCISADFYTVLSVAADLYRMTDGAWDGTVKPLIELWGFNHPQSASTIPDETKIGLTMQTVGFDKIILQEDHCLVKTDAALQLDLASIAKGYAVDQIAAIIRQQGITDFLVEIGGEVVASGTRLDGDLWRVGINTPDKDAAYDQVYQVVRLDNQAMATSGDYRKFIEVNGRRYAHVLDPRTGYPVQNGVVSVSIIAPDCMLADGLATAVMVMGPKMGIDLIDRLDQVECMIVTEGSDRVWQNVYSSGFRKFLSSS